MTQPLMPKATAVWLIENTALSFQQIAELLGCPLNTALTRAHYGLRKLREAMVCEI